ncbi:hypothetical protein BP00DRAFT_128322 [Aspergillus indologenus CBS 114.80]|uniref:Uncharacterized protein n=1 Tax=Aspergillus indologenus CBS 114.80 TaxID=1450541 RepID=A0A2V5HKI4_9EURO|nr:hypothetical protein BP00DRAFT_128322 [Aspergillus indologenus CBS 114.80]
MAVYHWLRCYTSLSVSYHDIATPELRGRPILIIDDRAESHDCAVHNTRLSHQCTRLDRTVQSDAYQVTSPDKTPKAVSGRQRTASYRQLHQPLNHSELVAVRSISGFLVRPISYLSSKHLLIGPCFAGLVVLHESLFWTPPQSPRVFAAVTLNQLSIISSSIHYSIAIQPSLPTS